MRVAIFSDVHGNLTALEAILADIKAQTPDMIFLAGDLCLGGVRPLACLQRIQQEKISPIYGNADELVGQQPLLSNDIQAEKQEQQAQANDLVTWTKAQLSEIDRAWLRSLPFSRRVSPTTNWRDDIFIVHANPHDVHQHIYPSEERQQTMYGEIKQSDDSAELRQLLHSLHMGILAFGHLHVPNIRQWRDILLVNISSVSLPLDGDPRAKYGLFTWQNDQWSITHQHVPYDMEAEIEQLTQIQPPTWQTLVQRLQTATA